MCAGAREVDRVCPQAAPNLQDALPGPALELRKGGNVRLDEVFPPFDFVKVLARADRCLRMAEVARACVPIVTNPIDCGLAKRGALNPDSHRRSLTIPSNPVSEEH